MVRTSALPGFASVLLAFGAAGALAAVTGCQDLLGLTPGKPSGSTGGGGSGATSGSTTGGSTGGNAGSGGMAGAGGTTGTTGSAGSGGMAGSGGTTASTSSGATTSTDCGADCVSSSCQSATCLSGQCMFEKKAEGTVIADPQKGDCRAQRCDAAGMLVKDAVLDDDSDDGNDCTWDACAGGLSGHASKRDGTPCKDGVCEGGKCTPGPCMGADGKKNGSETDVDCGGACLPCANNKICRVHGDCKSGFCASGTCLAKVALAVTVKGTQIAFATFTPTANPPWSMPVLDVNSIASLASAGIAFDAAGEAVSVLRNGGAGARSSRWSAGVFGPVTLWAIAGGAGAGSAWVPAFARTDSALYLFVQNTNLEHQFAAAGGNSGDQFKPAGGASSVLSGAAATRDGHASFFYAKGTEHLVETRYLGGSWSAPQALLDGDYQDSPPAVTTTDFGTLIVAVRRTGSDHTFDWLLLPDKAAAKSGELPAPKFASPTPPPKRLALATRADGGGILAFRDADGNLSLWTADPDGAGGVTWAPKTNELSATAITGEPSLARGIGTGSRAELMWISTGANAAARHSRLLTDGTWSLPPTDVVPGASTTVSISTP